MDSEDVFKMLTRLELPPGTRLGSFAVSGGRIFRLTQKESNGIQILLTDRVAGMQGEASSVISVLRRLREAARSPLPPALPDGQCQQIEFSGD